MGLRSDSMNKFFLTQTYCKFITMVLMLISLVLLIRPLSLIGAHIPIQFNEGWNAYFADAAVSGRAASDLYPPWFFSITDNYPPFSFYIVGYIGKIIGDNIIAGRIVNIVSIFSISSLIYLVLIRITRSKCAASISALSFLIYSETVFWRYFAIDDPQWLANAVSLLGLFVGIYAADKKPLFVLSAFLMIFAGFIKHNLIALPVATTFYLYAYDKKASYIFVSSAIISLLGLLCVCYAGYGINFFIDVFQNKRIIDVHRAMSTYKKILELFPLFIAFFVIIKNRGKYEYKTFIERFIIPFVCISLLFGAFQASADGVDYNCFFELLIALILSLGLYLGNLESFAPQSYRFISRILIVFSVFIVSVPVELKRTYHSLQSMKEESNFYGNIIHIIGNDQGAAICQDLSVCYWAHKKEIFDYFNTDQKMQIYKDNSIIHAVFKNNNVNIIESYGNDMEKYIDKNIYSKILSERGIKILKKITSIQAQ